MKYEASFERTNFKAKITEKETIVFNSKLTDSDLTIEKLEERAYGTLFKKFPNWETGHPIIDGAGFSSAFLRKLKVTE